MLLITAQPIRNLRTPASADMNKRGFLEQASPPPLPNPPPLFPFLHIPYPLLLSTPATQASFFPKEKFRAPVSRQVKTLKRNSQVSRPEFKSSRKLKRGLSFNDLIILVLDVLYANLEYQWTLRPALRSSKGCHFGWRSKLPAWKSVRI